MPPLPRIAVDAMGGDGGPSVTVPAAVARSREAQCAHLLLVGDESAIRPLLPAHAHGIEVVHAAERLSPDDSLSDVLRRRPDSSMRRALLLLGEGRADAVVSAGDTAALMALSRLVLDMVPGVERPAICKALAGVEGPFWMLDLGANLACTPVQLHQFALMGTLLARHAGGVAAPRTGLLNIGTESGKGPELQNQAAALMSADPAVDYIGFIEGNVLFDGRADVVVADGFAGNIALKSIEGAARMAGHLLRGWFDALNPLERAGMSLARGKLQRLRHDLNPQRYNGASFVGLSGVVVKSHGSADQEGFGSAIAQAALEVTGRVHERLEAALASGAPEE